MPGYAPKAAIATALVAAAAFLATPAASEDKIGFGFPDFGYMPKEVDKDIPVFQLSDGFPEQMPEMGADLKAITSTRFRGDNWKSYINKVKAYIFDGMVGHESYRQDFNPMNNEVRDWYHMPWMHWGPHGREGVHGLTQEGPLGKQMLHPRQQVASHAYAVGVFNARGGYPIGQVWDQPGEPPDLSYFKENDGFPNGTVIAKVLFTPLGPKQVPWLENPLTWKAYVEGSDVPNCNREACTQGRVIADVHLLQMDIMVRDDRVNDNGGWIFGTFAYNGRLDHDNKWQNLVPVGLMWGNDPGKRKSDYTRYPGPEKGTPINPRLEQTRINTSPDLPAQHLGWNGRLNGPADNVKSSCMSCHSTAQYPNAEPILPFLKEGISTPAKGTKAGDGWMRWFQNREWGKAFSEGQGVVNMDFSLQLSKSIKRYAEFLRQTEQSLYAAEYWHSEHVIRRNQLEE